MEPYLFFAEHRLLYCLSFAGAAGTAVYAAAVALGADDAKRRWGYGALSAVTAAQAAGLARWHPRPAGGA